MPLDSRRIAWGLATVAVAASVVTWRTAGVATPRVGEVSVRPLAELPTSRASGAQPTTPGSIRTSNPFRLNRRPAVRAERAATVPPAGPPVSSARAPQPVLVLAGIVGPPWMVLLEGVPGQESGTLMAVGQVASGIRVVSVHGDTVRLANSDTTWILTPRRWAP